jgi:hypothetical protein
VQNSTLIKLFAVLTMLIFIMVAILNFSKLNAPETAKTAPTFAKDHDYSSTYKLPQPKVSHPKPKTDGDVESDSDEKAEPKLPPEKVEEWLAKHNRNAMSLLAAFRSSGDTNYLNEAATNFPNDSHVELSVLAHNEFPADRRKWLDLFKASSPSNSLANYFSAEDYFKNGNTEAAASELLAASGKPQFDNYAMENELDAEELYSASGKSPIETASFAMSDMSEENLPELATFKRLANGIGDLEQQYVNSGDANSPVNLAQTGMTLANRLQSGDSGKYVINQMVGIADKYIVVSKLNPNSSYDFLDGQAPAQVLLQLKQQKKDLVPIIQSFNAIYIQMSPDEMVNYSERAKIYGELPAMKWVIQQHPPNNP